MRDWILGGRSFATPPGKTAPVICWKGFSGRRDERWRLLARGGELWYEGGWVRANAAKPSTTSRYFLRQSVDREEHIPSRGCT